MKRPFLLIGVLVVVAWACGSPKPPPATAPAGGAPKPTARAGGPDGGVSIVSLVPYMYNPVAKRDPFKNLQEETRASSGTTGTGTGICAEPLCAFDLDQLTLVAVVSGDANPVGMLEDPTKVGHVVHRNTRVGKQGGKVTAIQRDCVIVTEYFQSPDGKVNPNRVNICIKTDKASVPVLDLLQNRIYETQ